MSRQTRLIRLAVAGDLWLIVMALAVVAVSVARLDAAPMAGGGLQISEPIGDRPMGDPLTRFRKNDLIFWGAR
jgi:hypothetical protein